ncbi:MAG: hypothetical protein UU08_C0006G0036 [Candidatus Uhrbacteria bacterium GW2011_GWE2_40_58]|nr:MAG: hypothetical protein UT94_C0007G0012 [Candidatus Uhrbacteria bacterium GW2011_GWF2_40_263]KKR67917.1 MAG: hypothetical protein UU08_C0006G0036 [Candidatus Uhrbacteria bacterium GW2011_GWE2_40_58]OGL92516.1 MAG: tRNA (adenosine(37)-N6)-threonylcarbamoyltransferase complex ATPase subunit type 1 TsaE [Candidatus Uhrbacteria bacterium RIFOXYA2_FULL_40_9]OGL96886.1 MAG: tRNA (adenosine(37)-N6)-threonylcarbamoyltransferase complex ATPase subunit type 1 TsaE [Candidatus Uhrbacteria bacterium RI
MLYHSHSAEETKQIADAFAKTLTGGEYISLKGDLGTGKTTFVQGVAQALGSKDPVRSPTFTILNLYQTTHPYINKIVHLDCYRLRSCQDLHVLELEEWLNQPDAIILTEWPFEQMSEVKKHIIITLSHVSEQERDIEIKEK